MMCSLSFHFLKDLYKILGKNNDNQAVGDVVMVDSKTQMPVPEFQSTS